MNDTPSYGVSVRPAGARALFVQRIGGWRVVVGEGYGCALFVTDYPSHGAGVKDLRCGDWEGGAGLNHGADISNVMEPTVPENQPIYMG